MERLSDFDRGLLVGLLLGEGSFGGDGKQPQVTLRMHVRHEAIFRWLITRFPRSRLYGPYHHGGRSYYQWMARGRVLVEDLLPLLEQELRPDVDAHASSRLGEMCERYAAYIERERRLVDAAPRPGERPPPPPGGGSPATDGERPLQREPSATLSERSSARDDASGFGS